MDELSHLHVPIRHQLLLLLLLLLLDINSHSTSIFLDIKSCFYSYSNLSTPAPEHLAYFRMSNWPIFVNAWFRWKIYPVVLMFYSSSYSECKLFSNYLFFLQLNRLWQNVSWLSFFLQLNRLFKNSWHPSGTYFLQQVTIKFA